MKQRYTFLTVLGVSLLILAIAIFFPSKQKEISLPIQSLPWQIETSPEGSLRVFDLQLGRSTVEEAIQRFNERAEVSLFVSPENKRVVEVYFNNTSLAGLRAKIVLTVGIDKTALDAIYSRGTRISTLGDGSRKVTLHPDDLLRVKQAPITVLTYLPKTKLDDDLLLARFGEPDRRIRENKNNTLHWVYPPRGLDIARDESGRTVLQYLPPKNFAQVLQPLLEQGTEIF